MARHRTTHDGRRTPKGWDAGTRTAPHPHRAVVRLDTHAIRDKALKDHRKAERNLDRLKDQMKRYHEQDVPGFRTWMSGTFGRELTAQRELLQRIEDKRDFLLEVQHFVVLHDMSEVQAYRKVVWRRAHPTDAEEEDRKFAEEERTIYEEAARRREEDEDPFGDSDDERFDIPEEDQEDFSDFFEAMTGQRPPSDAFRKPRSGSTGDEKEVKALYRTIVRRLHPDRNGQMTDAVKDLWHAAQDAYQQHDINALYGILARCEEGEAGLGKHSPVSLIRRLTQQLKNAIRSANRDLRTAKRDVAWDFQNRSREPRFVHQIRHQVDGETRMLERDLAGLVSALSELEWRASRPERPARRRSPRPYRPTYQDLEFDLPF